MRKAKGSSVGAKYQCGRTWEYSQKERMRALLTFIAVSAAIVIAGKTCASSWYHWFAATAHCHRIFGYPGIIRGRKAVLKGLFLLLIVPVLFGLVVIWGYLGLLAG